MGSWQEGSWRKVFWQVFLAIFFLVVRGDKIFTSLAVFEKVLETRSQNPERDSVPIMRTRQRHLFFLQKTIELSY